jgi:hypothetical protein
MINEVLFRVGVIALGSVREHAKRANGFDRMARCFQIAGATIPFCGSLASSARPQRLGPTSVPPAGRTTLASWDRSPSLGSVRTRQPLCGAFPTGPTVLHRGHPLLLVLPDHQRNGQEQQYAICYEPTLSEITAAEFGVPRLRPYAGLGVRARWRFDEAMSPVGRDTFLTMDDLPTSAGAVDYSVRAVHSNHLIDAGSAVGV